MNWLKFKWFYFLLSSLILVPGVFSLIRFGFRPSIDFTGGTLLEYQFKEDPSLEKIQSALEEKKYKANSIQRSGLNKYLLRFPPLEEGEVLNIKNVLAESLKEVPEEVRLEVVGPTLGKELLLKTLIAVVLAAGFILLYVGWRFRSTKFGVCAILAMLHDTFILLGSFSLLGYFFHVEVDTLFVTAVLTLLSFSVHDTVVVYDRIRETQKYNSNLSFEAIINQAITETLVRSLNNSLTIIFMLIALVLLGGETMRWFVVALLIGTVAGTYSSTFTAAPLLAVWTKIESRRR